MARMLDRHEKMYLLARLDDKERDTLIEEYEERTGKKLSPLEREVTGLFVNDMPTVFRTPSVAHLVIMEGMVQAKCSPDFAAFLSVCVDYAVEKSQSLILLDAPPNKEDLM